MGRIPCVHSPGIVFLDGIRMAPSVVISHHDKFVLNVAVHIFLWSLSKIFTRYPPYIIGCVKTFISIGGERR